MANDRFYRSKEWHRVRRLVIRRDGGRCRVCHRPVTGREAQVDHVVSRRKRPDLALELGNCQLLCFRCHSSKGTASDGLFGQAPVDSRRACNVDGMPMSSAHPWASEEGD